MYDAQTMYNIKQAAARAGVTVPVLRAWERRYGVVHPARTASGYRLFDDEAVDRIRTMRALIAQGWSPSAAAAALVAGTVDPSVQPPSTAPAAGGRDGRAATASSMPGNGFEDNGTEAKGLADAFVAAARDMNPGAVDAVLDDVFARGSFERVATDVLFPALERLGDAWAAGEVSVAGEHMASSAVLRRLGMAFDAAASGDARHGRIVVGLPPGARHEFGALAFAVAARRAGLPVAYLGGDLPVEDWLAAAKDASAAVVGVVTPRDRKAALEVARKLRQTYPNVVVLLGGRAAPAEVDGSDVPLLPAELPEAVAALAARLQGLGTA